MNHRIPLCLLLAGAFPATAQELLFRDTFDRPDSRDIAASTAGVTAAAGLELSSPHWLQPFLDELNRGPAFGVQDGDPTNGGGARIATNRLELAVGAGTSNAVVDRNFTDAAILAAGGFSVSVDVTAFAGGSPGQGGGFGIGMSRDEALAAGDAISGTGKIQDGFADGEFNGAGHVAVSDFWVVLRGNSTLAWGGRGNAITGAASDTALFGTANVGAKTGTITARFAVPDFNDGSTVQFEVLVNGALVGRGSFPWTGTEENHIGLDARDGTGVTFDNFAVETWTPVPPPEGPNVVVILADDLGWGDLGSYGGEIATPHLDALAADGVRFRQFYNSARCSPTRVSLLTGLYPQQGAVNPAAALPDLRNDNNVTFAELLGSQGYRTYLAGKWHLGNGAYLPENRGFQHVWRMGDGQANNTNQWNQSAYTLVSQNNEIAFRDYTGSGAQFYQTDAIGDYGTDFVNHSVAKGDDRPFAMFLSFGAPHFPIQAPAELADAYQETYARGWDVLRRERYDRQLAMGVIDERYPFLPRGGVGPHQQEPIVAIPAWDPLSAARKADSTRRMALYAAMVEKLDENVGKVVERLRETNRLDDTLILFMSDNGGNHERGVFGTWTGPADPGPLTGQALADMGQPGPSGTANDGIHYGGAWSNVSNSPLKLSKHFTHEGGIRSPLIAHWPDGFEAENVWAETPVHLIDIMATIVDATGADYPETFNNHPVLPLEGESLLPLLRGESIPERSLFVEHEANRMVRKGKWKLVTEAWTAHDNEFRAHQRLLYDMDADPGETVNLAAQHPEKVVELVDEWNAWATRVGLPAARQIPPPPVNVTPGPTAGDLFVDTFNRADNVNIDDSAEGMAGSRVPPIGTGAAWFEGFEGSGTGSLQIADNILQMATGAGMSETGVDHNFIGPDILAAGGFSVSLRVLQIESELSDLANRYAGFGVGLNAADAAAGNDIGTHDPANPAIRGNGGGNPGRADCFVELDLNGNVKLWTGGTLRATVPVGKTAGTITAAFECDSFAAGSTVTVSLWFDGEPLDLGTAGTFTWSESDANHVALSARASAHVWVDNFAVRRLPLAGAWAIDHAISAGLDGADSAPDADPDGDGLPNFGEWAFGTNPARADGEVAATSIVLEAGSLRFAHRRLAAFAAAGAGFRYHVSEDLEAWTEVFPSQVAATALPASEGYEAVSLELPAADWNGKPKLFVRVSAVSP